MDSANSSPSPESDFDRTSGPRRNLRSLCAHERAEALSALGATGYRQRQVEEWLSRPEVDDFDAMTNLPKALREALSLRYSLTSATREAMVASTDGTRKYLVALGDGARVECVGIPQGSRLSVCVSTQAGCAMGCAFCATGQSGFARNLSAREIADQVGVVRRDFGTRVSSVVLMGQGEPFANYDASLEAMRLLNAPGPETIGARHITVSTSGIVPMIRRFAKESEQFTLAVSLHSAVQSTRDALMPGLKHHPLTRLHEALGDYCEATHRRPSYEYALIADVNDTGREIRALIEFCAGTLCHVNLIPLNPSPHSPLKPTEPRRVEQIRHRLEGAGIAVTVRESRGQDITAACGQLAQRHRLRS